GFDMVTDTISGPWNSWVTYYYETTLDVSMNHRYYFQFSDGEDQIRHPLASTSPNWLPGPVVELPNYPPTLMSERFTPLTGTRDTEYTFYVIYTDGENDRPVTTFLYLDGTAYVLTGDGYDYTNGVSHSFTTRLDVGPHEYHFVFSDGEHNVRLPVTGELEGPNVANRNPVAVISSPSDGVRFEPDEWIAFRSSGTDDADGDSLDYTWTSDLDGQLGTEEILDVHLSEGTHVITLLVEDPFSGSHGASVTILVKTKLPVLGIEGIELNVDNPIEGDAVRITASLSNSGEARAEGVPVLIFVDGVELKTDTVSLDIDDTRTVTAIWQSVAGSHEISVEIAGVSSVLGVQVGENDLPDVEITLVNPGEKFKPGEELYFQATVTDANDDPVAYEWDFGDMVTSTSDGPSHIYRDPGTYTVTLTVTDTRGGVTVETFTVEITKPKAEDESPGPGAILALAAMATMVAAMVIRSKDE
ncbi:MAG: PKD domain-containing protein, partial [Candidatus Thermoplasmatota archaeon]|nr:PKD domain-containing protein [Candidatus Thermoplasmatota archaeon]